MSELAWILLGFMTASWLFTLGTGFYLGWRYVLLPWRVMRADVVNLNTKLTELDQWVKNELGLRKALTLENEDLVRAEARLKARRVFPQ